MVILPDQHAQCQPRDQQTFEIVLDDAKSIQRMLVVYEAIPQPNAFSKNSFNFTDDFESKASLVQEVVIKFCLYSLKHLSILKICADTSLKIDGL